MIASGVIFGRALADRLVGMLGGHEGATRGAGPVRVNPPLPVPVNAAIRHGKLDVELDCRLDPSDPDAHATMSLWRAGADTGDDIEVYVAWVSTLGLLPAGTYVEAQYDAESGRHVVTNATPQAVLIEISVRDAFDTNNATLTGDVVWRASGTIDPNPNSEGLTIDNPSSAFYGDAGSHWYAFRESPNDNYRLLVPLTCPNTEYEY